MQYHKLSLSASRIIEYYYFQFRYLKLQAKMKALYTIIALDKIQNKCHTSDI